MIEHQHKQKQHKKLPIFCSQGLSEGQHGELIDDGGVKKSHIVRSAPDLAEIKAVFPTHS